MPTRPAQRARAPGKQRKTSGAQRAPRPSSKAELIVRQGFFIDATGKTQVAVPEIVILGNRDGFAYLAALFEQLASQAAEGSRSSAAAEGERLPRGAAPVNARLSDDLEFRFAPLTAANRAATLKRFGVTLKSRQEGSLFDRYQHVAEEQYQKVARKIARSPK